MWGGDGWLSASDSFYQDCPFWPIGPEPPICGGAAPLQAGVVEGSAESTTLRLTAGAAGGGEGMDATTLVYVYDTLTVSQGSSTYQAGQQVYLRWTGNLDGVLQLSRQFAGAGGNLRVNGYRTDQAYHVARYPDGTLVWDRWEPASLGFEEGYYYEKDLNLGDSLGSFSWPLSTKTVSLSGYIDVPVTIGESLLIQGYLAAYCWTEWIEGGGSCSSDFRASATITVQPAPGYAGIQITSLAQQAAAPPVPVPEFGLSSVLVASAAATIYLLRSLPRKIRSKGGHLKASIPAIQPTQY